LGIRIGMGRKCDTIKQSNKVHKVQKVRQKSFMVKNLIRNLD